MSENCQAFFDEFKLNKIITDDVLEGYLKDGWAFLTKEYKKKGKEFKANDPVFVQIMAEDEEKGTGTLQKLPHRDHPDGRQG